MLAPHRFAVVTGIPGRRKIVHDWLRFSVVVLGTLGASRHALAGSDYWSSLAASGSWSNGHNWGAGGIVTGAIPGATSGTANTDTATFNGGSFVTSIAPDANRNLEFITFDTSASQYMIGAVGGNSLLLTSGGEIQIASTFSSSSITETVNAPLKIEGSYTLADNSTKGGVLLDFGGAITSGSAGTQALTISGAGNTTIGGAIGGGAGTIALVKNGTGTLTLSGNNTFTGGLTAQNGTLVVPLVNNANTAGPLGNNASVTLGSSGQTGTLEYTGNAASSNMPFTLAPGGGAFQVEMGTANLTLSGVIGGSGGLTKAGAGTLTLAANNTFTGGVGISGGNLQIGNVGALNSTNSNAVFFGQETGAVNVSDVLTLGGNSITVGGLNGTDSVTLTITVQNQSATPATLTVNNATDNSYSGSLQDGAGGGALSLTKSGAGTLNLSGINSLTGAITIDGGTISLTGAGSNLTGQAVNLNGSLSTLLLINGADEVSALTGNGKVVGGSGAVLIVNNSATDSFSGSLQGGLALVKSGAGTLTLSGNNTFTGGVTINAGNLKLGSTGALNSANVVTFAPGSTGSLSLAGNSVTIGGLSSNGGNPIVQNAAVTPATLTVNDSATDNFSGLLQDGTGGGALSLTKSGPGTLTLAGTNASTGGTAVTGGTLNTTASGTLAPGPLTISAGSGVTSAVNLGNSQSVSSLSGTLASTGVATLSVGLGTMLTDNQSGGNTNFQGVLINSGTFAKSGTSSLEINSAPTSNTNSRLMVNGGKLRFNFVTATATVGTGVTATVASGATLELASYISAFSSGPNRVNITNNSPGAPGPAGLLVSGTNQQVGNIDGNGTTQVNAGSDLTANHIIQSALVIGGTAGSPGLVTIDASDSNGNSLGRSSGLAVAGSLLPRFLFTAGAPGSSTLDPPSAEGFSGDPIPAGPLVDGGNSDGNLSAVPEPATLLLFALGGLAFLALTPSGRAHRASCRGTRSVPTT